MSSKNSILTAKRVFQTELEELNYIKDRIDSAFEQSVNLILKSKGKVVLVGIGKSAHIANKIVATLNSTGTVAQFLHAAEAIHGDLGLLSREDVVIVLSKSGNTQELKNILPILKQRSAALIAITSNLSSELAIQADFVLDVKVSKEACPNGLAPTSSTTAQLVMGDALAVALMEQKGFGSEDFAKFHPGGSLGKKLLWKVSDIYNSEEKPKVNASDSMTKVIESLSYSKNGITVVMENDKIYGVITDGDLRRMLVKYDDYKTLKAKDIASANPKTVSVDLLAIKAFEILNDNKIGQLVVTDENGNYAGILDIHNLIKEGIS